MVSFSNPTGRPLMMVEIADDQTPQGWHWGEGVPGLLPGLSLLPVRMIGQAFDTSLTAEVVHEEDIPLAGAILGVMNRRIQQRKKTMWALDSVNGELRLGIYLPSDDAVDAFERALSKLKEWDGTRCSRRSRLFI
ncbi:hypothetical protein [Sphingobium abikonense]|uniref:hypothetical protein n=1 Tax=Sphingobium abikonense TaxID=86193 RepID=UPI003516CDD9